jgi:hypothetical protein
MLHDFRHNASKMRDAVEQLSATTDSLRIDTTGAFHDDPRFKCYQRLAGPVRRTLKPSDRVSFQRVIDEVRITAGAPHRILQQITADWHALQEELDAPLALGGGRVARRQILSDWLDAATFSNAREFKDTYGAFLDKWDAAGEGLAAQLTEQAAAIVLRLDEVVADMLEQPIVLPPPPPFVDSAARAPWWRRWFS